MLYVPKIRTPFCYATHDGFSCTRAEGHSGRHAATGVPGPAGRPVYVVWGQR